MTSDAEEFLRLTSDLLLVGRADGFFQARSAAWFDLFGWSEETLEKRRLYELVHGDDRARVIARLTDLAEGHEFSALECRLATRVGGYRWVSLRGARDATRARLLLVGKDIHPQKERDAFSDLFFIRSPVGLNLCTLEGTWLESNPAFLAMIGYRKEEADGKLSYWQLTPKKYDAMEQEQLARLRREGRYGPYEKEFIRADGSLVPVRLNGFIVHKGGQPYIWSIIEDITRERALKAEIEKKTALCEAIVETVPTALFVKSVADDFKITLWNRAAEQVFGRSRDEVIGKAAHELWPREQAEKYRADDEKVVAEGHLVDIPEEPSTLPGGRTIILHTKKLPLRLPPSFTPSLLLCVSEDITERKKLEDELRAAVEMRDEFLSIASHELRTPLTALSLQLEVLHALVRQPEGSSAERVAQLAQKALASCRQLADLMNELLDITRIRVGKLTLQRARVDLSEAIDKVVGLMAEELRASGSSIIVHKDGPIVGHWDPVRIDQVLWNLLSNAVKFGAGKPIEITARRDDAHARAVLTVSDQGVGISPAAQGVIFGRFERANPGNHASGLGLGLYIVRQVLEAHGGSIRVESEPGHGARFTVEVPLAPPDPKKSDAG